MENTTVKMLHGMSCSCSKIFHPYIYGRKQIENKAILLVQ